VADAADRGRKAGAVVFRFEPGVDSGGLVCRPRALLRFLRVSAVGRRYSVPMVSRRWRPAWTTLIILIAVWAVAVTGYHLFKNSRMTAERVRAFVDSKELSKLAPEDRQKALRELARRLNALCYEERRKVRFGRTALDWFEEMTEEERAWFVEETMPTGFKQMLTAFEELPEDKRKRVIDDALRGLSEARARAAVEESGDPGFDTNAPPISKEIEARVRAIGLRTFYTQSSARTKAELAPLLEEIQRGMESGRAFRRRR